MKTCTKCNIEKSLSEFGIRRASRDGLMYRCKECVRSLSSNYYANNSGRYANLRRTPRHKMNLYKARARNKGIPIELTIEDFEGLDCAECHYCGGNETMGFDRVDSSLGYLLDNVVPCCMLCNRAKNDLPLDDFLALIRRIAIHQSLEV